MIKRKMPITVRKEVGMDFNTKSYRYIILISSLSECFLLGGPTYGWPSLVYVLRDSGYFSDLCINSTSTLEFDEDISYRNISSREPIDYVQYVMENSPDDYPTCAEQDARLQLVFIIGSFGINSGALFFGFIYDKFGLRIARIISSSFILLACLLFAFSSPSTAFITFIALHLLATGGANLLLTNSQVGNLFGNFRSTIIALQAGAFGASALVMLFVQLAYIGGISLMASFCFLAGVTVFFNVNTFVLLPKYKFPWPLPLNWGKAVAVTPACSTTEVPDENELSELNESPTMLENDNGQNISWIDVEYPTRLSCLKSPLYLLFLMWFSIIQLAHLFYIGTVNPRLQLLSNDNDKKISIYTTIYTALHSTIIIFSFFCGLILDRNKRKYKTESGTNRRTPFDDLHDSALALLITNLITASFAVCSMIPILPLQIMTFLLQIMGRSFLFALLVSFNAMAFPAKYFGGVYGICRITGACFALLQYPLFQIVQQLFNENPFYVDLFVILLNACSLSLPFYVYWFVSKKKRIYSQTENYT